MGTRNKLTEYACMGKLKSKIGSKLSHLNSTSKHARATHVSNVDQLSSRGIKLKYVLQINKLNGYKIACRSNCILKSETSL